MTETFKRTEIRSISKHSTKAGQVFIIAARNEKIMKKLISSMKKLGVSVYSGSKATICEYGIKISFIASSEKILRTAVRTLKGKTTNAQYAKKTAKYVGIVKTFEQNLAGMSLKKLVELFNKKAKKQINRFSDRKSAIKRIKALV